MSASEDILDAYDEEIMQEIERREALMMKRLARKQNKK